jgi:serine/threonine protein phosphatase PrpC
MRFDFAQYAHAGGTEASLDAVRLLADDDLFAAVICDGLGGPDKGETVSTFCADEIINVIKSTTSFQESSPTAALLQTHQALLEQQAAEPAMSTARSTAAALTIDPTTGVLNWASLGDTRVYIFVQGTLAAVSPDDSAGYAAILRGETDHEGIRLFDGRDCLTAMLGDQRELTVHQGAGQLAPGDAVLICSDGLWEYVFDLEMQVDLEKSDTAEQWLHLVLLRLMQRSCLLGDAFSAVTCMVLD